MRYQIDNGKVWPSVLIDAPYDCQDDALDALRSGVTHNCVCCPLDPKDCKYNQTSDVIKLNDCKHSNIRLTGKFETEVLACPCGFKIPF